MVVGTAGSAAIKFDNGGLLSFIGLGLFFFIIWIISLINKNYEYKHSSYDENKVYDYNVIYPFKDLSRKYINYLIPEIGSKSYIYDYQKKIESSRTLNIKYDRYKSEDYFEGKRGTVKFEMFEFKAYKNDEDDWINTDDLKLHGFIIKGKANFPISKSLRIYPKKSTHKVKTGTLKIIEVKSSEYKNEFNLLGFTTENYDNILTDKLFKQIKDLQSILGKEIFISIFPKSVNIMIDIDKDYFEPNLKEKISMTQLNRVYNQFINFLLAIDIMEEIANSPTLKIDNNGKTIRKK